MQRILSREGANKRVSGNLFKAVVQKVLLFGAETWVVLPRMEWALKSFIRGSARRVTGTAAERVGREMVLPLTGGGHEGRRVHRCKDVYKQKAEHGRAIHYNETTSGPLQGDNATRRGVGDNEVVGPEGDRLGVSKSKGSGDIIEVGTRNRHGRGGDAGLR